MNTKAYTWDVECLPGFWNDIILAFSAVFSFNFLLRSHGLFGTFQTWWKLCTSLEKARSFFLVLNKEKSHQILQKLKFSHDLYGDVSAMKPGIMHGLARLCGSLLHWNLTSARHLYLATVSSLSVLFLIL